MAHRRGPPAYVAFDLVWLNGADLGQSSLLAPGYCFLLTNIRQWPFEPRLVVHVEADQLPAVAAQLVDEIRNCPTMQKRSVGDLDEVIFPASHCAPSRNPKRDAESTMTTHKFAIGQAVSFSPDRGQLHIRGELFTIVGLLPETADTPQYRIKSQTDGHERVAREDQLAVRE